jgi:hypothetical protein
MVHLSQRPLKAFAGSRRLYGPGEMQKFEHNMPLSHVLGKPFCTRLRHDDYPPAGRVVVWLNLVHWHLDTRATCRCRVHTLAFSFFFSVSRIWQGIDSRQHRHEPTCCLDHSSKPMFLRVHGRQGKNSRKRRGSHPCCYQTSIFFGVSAKEVAMASLNSVDLDSPRDATWRLTLDTDNVVALPATEGGLRLVRTL